MLNLPTLHRTGSHTDSHTDTHTRRWVHTLMHKQRDMQFYSEDVLPSSFMEKTDVVFLLWETEAEC